MSRTKLRTFLVVYVCPEHKNPTLVLEMESGSGTRVIGRKCCERVYAREFCRWEPTQEQWESIQREAEEAQ